MKSMAEKVDDKTFVELRYEEGLLCLVFCRAMKERLWFGALWILMSRYQTWFPDTHQEGLNTRQRPFTNTLTECTTMYAQLQICPLCHQKFNTIQSCYKYINRHQKGKQKSSASLRKKKSNQKMKKSNQILLDRDVRYFKRITTRTETIKKPLMGLNWLGQCREQQWSKVSLTLKLNAATKLRSSVLIDLCDSHQYRTTNNNRLPHPAATSILRPNI